jgi:hypothetical protein
VDVGFDALVQDFLDSLGGKSARTYATYQTGLAACRTFLVACGQFESWQTAAVKSTLLEDFYTWPVRQHGRERRAAAPNTDERLEIA